MTTCKENNKVTPQVDLHSHRHPRWFTHLCALLTFSTLSLCAYFGALRYSLVSMPVPSLRVLSYQQSVTTAVNMTTNDYLKYITLITGYEQELSKVKRQVYEPKKNYIDCGEPVSKYIPKGYNGTKRILGWTQTFDGSTWIPKDISCVEGIKCVGTHERSQFNVSDAVVMHARDLRNKQSLPKTRLLHQRWIHFVMESPYHLGINTRDFNGIFNWTATYRLDSDTPAKYFSIRKRDKNLTEEEFQTMFKSIMDSKSKLIAQMNSNCHTPHSNRQKYVRDLQKFIDVNTYGACGKLKCPRGTKDCENTMTQHKFYMSMENSNCRDYLTEKVRNPMLNWNSVPIVMGGADPSDYERILPPDSYIHTSGFESTKELGEYLLLLDKYPSLYERYHRWRMTHEVETTGQVVWCHVCRKLHDESLPVQTYRDFESWYNEDTCKI